MKGFQFQDLQILCVHLNDIKVIQEQHWLRRPLSKIILDFCKNLSYFPLIEIDNETGKLKRYAREGEIVPEGSWDDEETDKALRKLIFERMFAMHKDPDHLHYSNHGIIQPLFKNTLGHCVSEPAVKPITYPTHHRNYDVRDKLSNETSNEHLHQFFAKALKVEIEGLL